MKSLRGITMSLRGSVKVANRNKGQRRKEETPLRKTALPSTRGVEKIVIKATGQHPSLGSKQVPETFSDLKLRPDMVQALSGAGITKPTVIQMLAIPKILKGRHLLCAAETGSGKTIAYLAPLINLLRREEEDTGVMARLKRPRALVLLPSRTLASQVLGVAKLLCHTARFKAIGIIGGYRKKRIREALQTPCDLAVTTVDSLLKFKKEGRIDLSDVTHVVIDEADTLLDQTFMENLKSVLKDIKVRQSYRPQLPASDAQVTMVTATVSNQLLKQVQKILPMVDQVSTNSLHQVLPSVAQVFLKVKPYEKAEKLLSLLQSPQGHHKVMVFCNTVTSCEWTYRYLKTKGIDVTKLHGGVDPALRNEKPLKQFMEEGNRVLVCTDAASRGIDCSQVKHVVLFDFPTSMTNYLHRVGRTGRVGSVTDCRVTSFMTKKIEVTMALKIQDAANRKKPIVDENLKSTAG